MTVKEKRKTVADDVLGQLARKWNDLFARVRGGVLTPKTTLDVLQQIIEGEFEKGVIPRWIKSISYKEEHAHNMFFGRIFDVTEFEKTLKRYGRKLVEYWQSLGLEPHFLPEVAMSQEAKFSGWKKRPEEWYYEQVAERKISRSQPKQFKPVKEVKLGGISVLIDTRARPLCQDGRQMFKDDNLLGPIIKKLRQEGRKLNKYKKGPQSSRFGISGIELIYVKFPLAKSLNIGFRQIRLETVIEENVIPQIYPHMPRSEDGKKNTWVWCEEWYDENRQLCIGSPDVEKDDSIGIESRAIGFDRIAFRPLIVL